MPNNRRGRAPSGPWTRLKPVELDPLESIGLPSKGDSRLLDLKCQEKYYSKIVDRYKTVCSAAGQGDELLRQFSSLDINATGTAGKLSTTTTAHGKPEIPVSNTVLKLPGSKDLSDILAALRKLREGIVASKRVDEFTARAYLFCIRLSILAKQPESYHPAMLHLLRFIHPQRSLAEMEVEEVVGYLVLDTACRRRQLAEAISIRHHFKLRDKKVGAVLLALVHDNYVSFRRIQRSVDGYKVRLMEWADQDVRVHTLKCLGRTYLSLEKPFLESVAGSTWEELTTTNSVGWELEQEKVIIRKPRPR